MLNEPECGNCLYFCMDEEWYEGKQSDFEVGGVNGTCRRQCPVAQKPDDDGRHVSYGYWPEVLSGNWCGEYRENTRDGHERTRKLLNDSEYESKRASQRNTSSKAYCSGKRWHDVVFPGRKWFLPGKNRK